MSFSVLLDNFEGPLDLLLQLIERDKLDVREVQLSKLTASYIEHMQKLELHPHEVNHFLSIAAQLVFTKSRRVLPRDINAGLDEEYEAGDIADRLELYQSYRALASKISQLSKKPYLSQNSRTKSLAPRNMSVSVDDIKGAWESLKQRAKPDSTPRHTVRLKPVRLKDMTARVLEHLDQSGQITLSDLCVVAGNRREAVLSFLAILEIAKQNRIIIKRLDENSYELWPVAQKETEVLV